MAPYLEDSELGRVKLLHQGIPLARIGMVPEHRFQYPARCDGDEANKPLLYSTWLPWLTGYIRASLLVLDELAHLPMH